MAATTSDIGFDRVEASEYSGGPVAAATILYMGALAAWDASGNLVNATDSTAVIFAGVVAVQVDNSAGAAGDKDALLYADGKFRFTGSGFAAGDVGKRVYAADNQTVVTGDGSLSGYTYVGTISRYISATRVEVALDVAGARQAKFQVFNVIADGVNAAAIELSASAAKYGGSDIHVTDVIYLVAGNTTAGNAEALLVTTDYTVASGDITLTADRSAAGTKIYGAVIGRLEE